MPGRRPFWRAAKPNSPTSDPERPRRIRLCKPRCGLKAKSACWPARGVGAPRQALARLHAVAAVDLITDPDLLGRPSDVPGVADRLDTLAGVLSETSAPALVVAAVVQGEISALDAFPPVSGIVARAAERLTLIDLGLDPKSLVTFEVGHWELRPEFESTLTAYQDGSRDGLSLWIGHCADAIVVGARETTAICEAIARG